MRYIFILIIFTTIILALPGQELVNPKEPVTKPEQKLVSPNQPVPKPGQKLASPHQPVMMQGQELVYPNQPKTMIKSNSGLITMVEYNGGYGVGNAAVPYSKSFNGLNVLVGYELNRSFIISGGTGISFYNGGSLIPLYGDMRYTFILNRVSAYLYGDGGLLMKFSNFAETKIFLNPGIGVRYSISRNIAVNLSAGIFIQSAPGRQDAFVNLRTGLAYKF